MLNLSFFLFFFFSHVQYLNHNNFIGVVPDTIEHLPNLKKFQYAENNFKNTVENIGNADVYSNTDHVDLAEAYYKEWKNGIAFDSKQSKRLDEESRKRKEFQQAEAENNEAKENAIDKKALAMLPPAFRPGGGGGGGGGSKSLGEQVGGGGILDGT